MLSNPYFAALATPVTPSDKGSLFVENSSERQPHTHMLDLLFSRPAKPQGWQRQRRGTILSSILGAPGTAQLWGGDGARVLCQGEEKKLK